MAEINESTPATSIASKQAPEAIDLANVAFSISVLKKNLKQFT